MPEKDDAQKKLLQMQILQSNYQMLQERLEFLNKNMEDLLRTRQTLEESKNISSDALIPLGSNNFVSGRISDTKTIIVGIGAGVAVRKTREDAMGIMDSRIKDLQNAMDESYKELQAIVLNLSMLQSELEKRQK